MSSVVAAIRAKRREDEEARVLKEKSIVEFTMRRAAENGMVEKTAGESGQAGVLRNKWIKWLDSAHGAEVKARLAAEGGAPTVEEAKLFSTWVYSTRQMYAPNGAKGCSDAYGLLQIPYMLAKLVFPLMKYDGFVGLTLAEAKAKNQAYVHELKEHWKALKVAEEDPAHQGSSMSKQKWDDVVYFLAQDRCLADMRVRPNRAVQRLAIMGFVRTTCCRSGSFARDWFDRAGKAARWVGENVLSVEHFTWDREGFYMVLPDGSVEEDALLGDVDVQRIKFHYFEKYQYQMSMTPDALEMVRRASTWLLISMWRRGLFEVQYTGMSAEERAVSISARHEGIEGGMPPGARVSSNEAFQLWLGGQRAYLPELMKEPMFVRLNTAMQYTTTELHTSDVGAVFSELGAEMGLEPGASGLNSGRRNGVVGTSKALDERGMTQMLAKKLMQHKAKSGVATIEVCYDDSTATSDMGALLCGRAMMEKKAQRGLLATRCPELAQYRVFSDVASDDPLRRAVFDDSAERAELKEQLRELQTALADLTAEEDSEVVAEVETEIKATTRNLMNLEGRLRHEVLDRKKKAVFAEGLAQLSRIELTTLRERRTLALHPVRSLAELVEEFGNEVDCTLYLSKQVRKRASVSTAQAEWLRAGVPWSVVKSYPEGRAVTAKVRCGKGGAVRLRVCASTLATALSNVLGKRERGSAEEEALPRTTIGDRLRAERSAIEEVAREVVEVPAMQPEASTDEPPAKRAPWVCSECAKKHNDIAAVVPAGRWGWKCKERCGLVDGPRSSRGNLMSMWGAKRVRIL